MKFTSLIENLQLQLQQPLPGQKAQLSLFSGSVLEEHIKRLKSYDVDSLRSTARQSSVLILLYEHNGEVFLPLIQRPVYDGVHSGQIALPGGKQEPSDIDEIETALREAYEEIGVDKTAIEVLGQLTPVYIPPSNFLVNVVLGYAKVNPSFVLDRLEVEKLIAFPLSSLVTEKLEKQREVRTSSEFKMNTVGYLYEDHFIWGATSMMLSELRSLVLSSIRG
jgi:8-oxo-dGTP pyrophosphatase MutT (NUDIX family)